MTGAGDLKAAVEEYEGGLTSRQYFFVVQWIAVSSGLTMFNKYVLSSGFHYPMLMTSWHMLICTIGSRLLLLVRPDLFPSLTGENKIAMTPEILAYRIFPIALFFATSLILANTAYIYLSVAYVQMIKASIPVITMFIMFCFKLEEPTSPLMKIIFIISGGVMMAAHGERHFNMFGFVVCVCGVCAEACRLTLVNVLLSGKGLKMDALTGLYYFSPLCFMLIATACYLLEFWTIPADAIETLGYGTFLLNGFVAFYLNLATVYLIKECNALVMCLGGIVKDVFLVSVSTVLFNAEISNQQVVGYGIALVGLHCYKEFKKDKEAFEDGIFAGLKASMGSSVVTATTIPVQSAVGDAANEAGEGMPAKI